MATNSGTLPFNHVISGSSNQGWNIEVVGDGIVDLAVGESNTIKLLVTPTSDGLSDITLTFNTAENADTATYLFTANAEKQSSESAAFGLPVTQIGLIAILIIALIGAGILILKPKSPKQHMPIMPLPVNILANQQIIPGQPPTIVPQVSAKPVSIPPPQETITPVQQKQAPICWQCRSPIVGKVVGCPKCGARYCGDESENCKISTLEACLSCQSPVSTFISE